MEAAAASKAQDILREAPPWGSTFCMVRFCRVCVCTFCVSALPAALARAQGLPKTPAAEASSSAEQGISLAARGRRRRAVPILKHARARLTDNQADYRTVMSTARGAMSLD